jgi:hypothetical protein
MKILHIEDNSKPSRLMTSNQVKREYLLRKRVSPVIYVKE